MGPEFERKNLACLGDDVFVGSDGEVDAFEKMRLIDLIMKDVIVFALKEKKIEKGKKKIERFE